MALETAPAVTSSPSGQSSSLPGASPVPGTGWAQGSAGAPPLPSSLPQPRLGPAAPPGRPRPRALPRLTCGPRASGSRRSGALVPMAAAAPLCFAGPAPPLPSREGPGARATPRERRPGLRPRLDCAAKRRPPLAAVGWAMRGETAWCSLVMQACWGPRLWGPLRVVRPSGVPARQRGKRGPTPVIPRYRLLVLPRASGSHPRLGTFRALTAMRRCRQPYCCQASLWILPANIHDT